MIDQGIVGLQAISFHLDIFDQLFSLERDMWLSLARPMVMT
jgi:hypothetical protein